MEVVSEKFNQNLKKENELNTIMSYKLKGVNYILATELNEEENQIFLRGRNNAPHGYRKNVDKKAYATSTGLEAVIGYLYLTKNMERLNYLVSKMFAIVEEEKNEHIR